MQTKHKPGTLEALAQVIADRVNGAKPVRPALRLVQPPRPTLFDSITKECMIRRVRWLTRTYNLAFIQDQATFNQVGLEALADESLAALLQDLERARECIEEGIPLEDAGFVIDPSRALMDTLGL